MSVEPRPRWAEPWAIKDRGPAHDFDEAFVLDSHGKRVARFAHYDDAVAMVALHNAQEAAAQALSEAPVADTELERLRGIEAIAHRLVIAYEEFEGSHWHEEEMAYRDLKAALSTTGDTNER